LKCSRLGYGHENMKVAPIDAADVFCPLHAVGEANIKAD